MACAVSRLMSVCRPLRHSKWPFWRAPVSRRSASTSSWVGTSSMAYLPFVDDSIVSEVFVVIHAKVVLPRYSAQFFLDAVDFILHVLFAVDPRAEPQGGRDARRAHGVDHFVTALDGREN